MLVKDNHVSRMAVRLARALIRDRTRDLLLLVHAVASECVGRGCCVVV